MVGRAGVRCADVGFGYTADGNVDPQESVVVKDIFERFYGGESLRSLVRLLEDRKVPTRAGRPWNTRTVHDMLTNPCYAGCWPRSTTSTTRGSSTVGAGARPRRRCRPSCARSTSRLTRPRRSARRHSWVIDALATLRLRRQPKGRMKRDAEGRERIDPATVDIDWKL